MRPHALIAALLVAVAGCTSLDLERTDGLAPIWATEGETSLRDNAVPDRITPPLVRRWDFNAGAGFGVVSPLIVGDIIFVATRQGEIHAIDVESGNRVGKAEFGDAIEGTPVYDGGTLVIPLAWGGSSLHAHNLLMGTRQWRVRGAPVQSGLVVYGRTVIAGDVEGTVRAYQLDTGKEVWSRQIGERSAILSTPVLVNDRLIAATDDGHVVAIDARDGSEVWFADIAAPVQVSLAATSDFVFASTTRGRLRAIDLSTGETHWEYAIPSRGVYFAAPAVGEWEVVFGASDGIVRALDRDRGSVRWATDVEAAVAAPPVITDAIVYVGTLGGKLKALDRDSGAVVWETELEGRIKSAFAVTDSRLVVLAEPRLVYLFESTSGPYATREE